MEGITVEELKPEVENKTEAAAKSVVERFYKKLAEVLDRIGENPYFRDLEQTI